MKIIETIKINKKSDIIYAQITLKNYFKIYKTKDKEFLTLALTEIATNILKYAKDGEIWLIDENGFLAVVGLDKGKGIKDIEWALKRGHSTLDDSLGDGLYVLRKNEDYLFEIVSVVNKGTIVGVFNFNLEEEYLSIPLYPPYSGDFYFKKYAYSFFGDVADHGIQAYKSVELIKKFFFKDIFKCEYIDIFFNMLNKKIKKLKLRGFVGAIIYQKQKEIEICGVGNISIFHLNKEIKKLYLKDGMIGEIYDTITKITLNNGKMILFSDGIEEKNFYEFLNKNKDISNKMITFCAIWFFRDNDDASILIKDIE